MSDQNYTPEQLEQMETPALLALYKETGDENLKWMIAIRYEGIIRRAALRMREIYSSFTQVEDIINEGIIALLGAIDKYDPTSGIKFETFVSKRIRGLIIDLARNQDWLPRNTRQTGKEIDRTVDELTCTLGRYPTEVEVAERMGMPLEKYQKTVASVSMGKVLPLDALMDAQRADGYRFEPAVSDYRDQPELVLQEKELLEKLAEGIGKLRKNEQLVLSFYYEQNLRLKEIAQVMNLSEPRISQIHSRAVDKLRQYIADYMNDGPQKPQKTRKRG